MRSRARAGRRRLRAAAACGGVLAALPWIVHRDPPPAPGVREAGAWRSVPGGELRVLLDQTAWDPRRGERVVRQEIFDEVLRLAGEAENLVYLDFFLWNPWQGVPPETHRAMAAELAEAVVRRKAARPGLEVLVLSDPINTVYDGARPPWFDVLAAAGAHVVFTDLDRLPDSNLLYSPPVRLAERLLPGRAGRTPRWRHPFDAGGGRVSTAQLLRLLHFKANHRKVAIADGPGGTLRAVVTSMNPADGSSAHSNVGIRVGGAAAADALMGELDVWAWSCGGAYAGARGAADAARRAGERVRARWREAAREAGPEAGAPGGAARARWVTEGAIRDALLDLCAGARAGDEVRAAVFYLSDRGVVKAIKDAARRGARVRVILDRNRDAFGRVKNGVPNRPVAAELVRWARRRGAPLEVRWADTRGEQFHTKALLVDHAGGTSVLAAGSANWTRRNLADLNLEADLVVEGVDLAALDRFREAFDLAWTNGDGLDRTQPYERYADPLAALLWKTPLYRFQEATGLSTF